MPRFYCPPPLPSGALFELPPGPAHHAFRVLRLRENDRVEIFDGLGNECRGAIVEIGSTRVIVGEITPADGDRESPLRTILAQAMSSSEKMDWVIQKATELGVAEIQPLDTERSVAKLPAERAAKRFAHWQQVAISACEQCGRNLLPEIQAPVGIMAWLQKMNAPPGDQTATKFILLPNAAASLHAQSKPKNKAVLLIGPEGGFTDAESESALNCGFAPIRLGARVLRTETAAIAGLAALQTLWGDFL